MPTRRLLATCLAASLLTFGWGSAPVSAVTVTDVQAQLVITCSACGDFKGFEAGPIIHGRDIPYTGYVTGDIEGTWVIYHNNIWSYEVPVNRYFGNGMIYEAERTWTFTYQGGFELVGRSDDGRLLQASMRIVAPTVLILTGTVRMP